MKDTVPGGFRKRHQEEIRTLAACYRKELMENVIPFWESRTADMERGGYFTSFDREGNRINDEKPGWFIGRTMHTFSALHKHFGKKPHWLEIAQAGRRALDKAYLGDGRFARQLDGDGNVTEGAVSIFTDHFVVKGLYEYISATGNKQDIPWAKELTEKLFENVKRPAIIATECSDSRFQKHALNFMNLIVALESRQIFGDAYEDMLRECVHKSLYVFANDGIKAQLEYMGQDGQPILEGPGRLFDPGHTMESLWFSMEAAEALQECGWSKRAGEILDWVIEKTWDEEFGGFYQCADVENTKVEAPFDVNLYVDLPVAWNDKIWWTQAEGLCALAMSALRNENERHFEYFLRLHRFIDEHFRDKEYGEWYSFVHRDGSLYDSRKGFALKGAYHVPRCLMIICRLFENWLDGETV